MAEKVAQSTEAQNFIQTLVVQPAKLQSADVLTYKNAVNQAKWGFYSQWFDLVDNLLSDPFLQDQIDKLVGIVTNADLQFQIDGKSVDVINDLIETTEFEELLTEIVHSKVFGKSVVNTSFAPQFDIFSFPRKHIYVKNIGRKLSDREKVITTMPGGLTGYDYTQDEFILEFGKDGDLGIMFRVAQYVIYKRGNFGDWAQYAEIFGMPFVLGKYDSTDTNARDQLFTALSEIGGKPYAAAPKSTEIEVVWNSGSGSTDLYKSLKDACDEQIMIGVLGETMTTISGSSRSQSETHQGTLDEKGKTLCRFVQRQLNSKFLPLLAKRGYPVNGGKFVFPEAKEEITVDKLTSLSKIMRIPAKWAHNKFAIPMAEDGEEILGETKPDEIVQQTPEPPVTEQPTPDPKKPTEKVDKKKEVKLSDTDAPGFWKEFFGFFANARTIGSRAMSALNLADKSTNFTAGTNIDKLFERALKEIYAEYDVEAQGVASPLNKNLFDISNKALQRGIDKTFSTEFGKSDAEFINQFKTNAAVFSAFKTHAQGKEIVTQLLDENGELRSFDKFRKSVLGTSIKADYNINWLKTEYNMAVRSARMAEKLKGFERVKHLYPNLKFIESTASEKRPEHLKWVGTILPLGHWWWKTHTPPVEWGCECSIENTDEEVTGVPDGDVEVDPVFANNPAETAEFINLKEHPMVKAVTDEDVAQSIIEFAKLNIDDEWQVIKTKNGILRVASGHGKSERAENIDLAKYFADKYGYEIDLIATNNSKKTADSLNKTLGVEQEYKHNKKATISAIDNELRDAKRQSDHIVLNIKSKIKTGDLINALKDRVRRAENIQSIWIKIGKFDKQYTRAEILSPGFKIQRD